MSAPDRSLIESETRFLKSSKVSVTLAIVIIVLNFFMTPAGTFVASVFD